jgi:hypothetical protein
MLIQFHHRRDINKKYLSYRVLLLFLWPLLFLVHQKCIIWNEGQEFILSATYRRDRIEMVLIWLRWIRTGFSDRTFVDSSVAWWLRHYVTNRQVAGSMPDEVTF